MKVSEVVPPTPTVVTPKALVMVGRETTDKRALLPVMNWPNEEAADPV